ncbi:hypothetical protein Q3G72_034511 [Acer saccharum]|nr:hypothetical protein Q3G72_034511 [Acer saccharum]
MNFYRAANLFHKAKTAGKNLLMVDAGTGVFGIAVLNPSTKDCSPVERYSFDLKKPDSKTHRRVHHRRWHEVGHEESPSPPMCLGIWFLQVKRMPLNGRAIFGAWV